MRMNKIPSFTDFECTAEHRQALVAYRKSFELRVLSGLTLIISPNQNARQQLLYAVVQDWVNQGITDEIDQLRVAIVEKRTRYIRPDHSSWMQVEYGNNTDSIASKLRSIVRMDMDLIALDAYPHGEIAELIQQVYCTGARIIAAVQAETILAGLAPHLATPPDVATDLSYGLDLVLFAPAAGSTLIPLVLKPDGLLKAIRERQLIDGHLLQQLSSIQ